MDFIHIRQGEVNTQKWTNITHHINRLKGGKKTGSTRCRKKTIQQQFDNLSRWNTQQTTNHKLYDYQHNKCHYEKSTAIGKEWKKAFPLRSRRQGCTLCTAVQESTETLRAIRWEKEIKGPKI